MAKIRLYVSSYFDVDIPNTIETSKMELIEYMTRYWAEHIDEEQLMENLTLQETETEYIKD